MDSTRSDSGQGTAGAAGGARERRVYPRTSSWGTAWIGVFPEGTRVMGYLMDLGLGGCRIEADAAIPAIVGARVEVLLQLEGSSLRLAGAIRRLEENGTRAGIEFADVNPRKAEQLEKLIDQLLAGAE